MQRPASRKRSGACSPPAHDPLFSSLMRLHYTDLTSSSVKITGPELNYLKNVLRAKKGDRITLFDGKGNFAEGEISEVSRNQIGIEIKQKKMKMKTESPLKSILVQGILKGQKMDMVVQKATELGVSIIQPVMTVRTEVRETRKVERWRKIAAEASKQCGRAVIPRIEEPLPFDDFMNEFAGDGIIFWEEGGESIKNFKVKSDTLAIAVGPEGGFTPDEVALAVEKGFYTATLGPRILRAETASITALSLAQFLFGDLG